MKPPNKRLNTLVNSLVIIIFIAIALMFSGCVNFNSKELKILHTYKKGEVLIFKSLKTSQQKSYTITDIEDYSHGYNETNGGPARVGEIWYTTEHDGKIYNDKLLMIMKNNDRTEVLFCFEFFLSNQMGKLNTIDSILIDSFSYKNFYTMSGIVSTNNYPVEDQDIIKIYWKENLGLIKYDLRNGDSFVRINIDNSKIQKGL